MPQSGIFWHLHHDRLLEGCYSYDGRAAFIRTHKASHEQELRLRLFQPVRGELPQEVIDAWKAYNEAVKAYDETGKAYDDAWKAYNEARRGWNYLKRWTARKAYNEAVKAFDEAVKTYNEGWEARDEALSNHKDEVEALHAQECLDCPWDGKTIFPAA